MLAGFSTFNVQLSHVQPDKLPLPHLKSLHRNPYVFQPLCLVNQKAGSDAGFVLSFNGNRLDVFYPVGD